MLDTRTLRLTTLAEFGQQLAQARIVCVSEMHDQASHHRAQAQLIDLLAQQPGRTSIGMEMFNHRSQEALDKYTAGKLTEQRFLSEVAWKSTWGYEWSLYAPILRTARRHSMPVVGLDLPRSVLLQIHMLGLDKIPAWLRQQLPKTIVLDDAAHREHFFRLMRHSPDTHKATRERDYQLMCIRDSTMAETAARYLKTHPKIRRMVVLAGIGHIAFGHGVPKRAATRDAGPYVIVVPRTADQARVDTVRADILRPPGRYIVFAR